MVHHKYLTFEPWPRIQNHPFLTASTRFSLLHNLGLMCLLHLLPSRLLSENLRKQRLFAETALTFFKIGFLVIWLFDQIAYKCSMYLIEPVCTFSASLFCLRAFCSRFTWEGAHPSSFPRPSWCEEFLWRRRNALFPPAANDRCAV